MTYSTMYNLSNALIQNMFLVAMAMAAIFIQQQQGADAFGSFIKDLFNKTTIKLQNFQVPMIIYVLNYAQCRVWASEGCPGLVDYVMI